MRHRISRDWLLGNVVKTVSFSNIRWGPLDGVRFGIDFISFLGFILGQFSDQKTFFLGSAGYPLVNDPKVMLIMVFPMDFKSFAGFCLG